MAPSERSPAAAGLSPNDARLVAYVRGLTDISRAVAAGHLDPSSSDVPRGGPYARGAAGIARLVRDVFFAPEQLAAAEQRAGQTAHPIGRYALEQLQTMAGGAAADADLPPALRAGWNTERPTDRSHYSAGVRETLARLVMAAQTSLETPLPAMPGDRLRLARAATPVRAPVIPRAGETDLLGMPITPPARVSPTSSVTPTADRGVGAPNYRTAREAVRQDAVTHGGADRDSMWDRRQQALNRRAKAERQAADSGHLSFFTTVPGSSILRPDTEVDPFSVLYEEFRRSRAGDRQTDARSVDRECRLFMGARHIEHATETDPERGPLHVVTHDVQGLRFVAKSTELRDALDSLAYTVKQGPDAAIGPTPTETRGPTALERAWAHLSEDERAYKQAFVHFGSRKQLFTRSTTNGFGFSLTQTDLDIASKVGVTPPPDAALSDERTVRTFFMEIDERTKVIEEIQWEGLTKTELPGESQERVTGMVGGRERRVNDRYGAGRDRLVDPHQKPDQVARTSRAPSPGKGLQS